MGKAKHRVRVGGGLQHGQGELRYLAEAEADSFREKIAAELQLQLQDLPIKEVARAINQILKTETAEKDTGFTDAIKTITKLQHRVKRTILRRRLLAAAVAENARRHTGVTLGGPLQASFNREQTSSGTRLDSGDDKEKHRQHAKRHTASRDQLLHGHTAGSDGLSTVHEYPLSVNSSRAKEHRVVRLTSHEQLLRAETSLTIDRSYEDALNKLSSVGAHL